MLDYLKSLNLPYRDTARVRWGLLRAVARIAGVAADAVMAAMREWWPITAGDAGLATHAVQLEVAAQRDGESDRDYRLRVAREPGNRRVWGRRGPTGELLDGLSWREYPREGERFGRGIVGADICCAGPMVVVSGGSAEQLGELERRLAPDIAVVSLPPPSADAGGNQERWVRWGEPVILDGRGSTGWQPATIAWTQTSGAAVVLHGQDTIMPLFAAPNIDSDLVFQVSLSASGEVSTADVTIRVGVRVHFPLPVGRSRVMAASIVRGSNPADPTAYFRTADNNSGGVTGLTIGSLRDGFLDAGSDTAITRIAVIPGTSRVRFEDNPDPDRLGVLAGFTGRVHIALEEGNYSITGSLRSSGDDFIEFDLDADDLAAVQAITVGRSFGIAITA